MQREIALHYLQAHVPASLVERLRHISVTRKFKGKLTPVVVEAIEAYVIQAEREKPRKPATA